MTLGRKSQAPSATRGLVETRRVSLARGRTCRGSDRCGRSHPGRARRSLPCRQDRARSRIVRSSPAYALASPTSEHDVTALDVPPQNDLRWRLADVIGDPGDDGIAEHLALRYRRPRFGGDAVILPVLAHGFVCEIGVYLDLVHRRHRVGHRGQPLQVFDLEVRHADGAGTAVVVKLFERLPGGDVVAIVERRQRPVDQEQVHVVEAEIGERRVECLAGVVRLVQSVVKLARNEDLPAVDARGANPLADLSLVAVHFRRVDVPVAYLDGLSNRLCSLVWLDLKYPETELRDGVSIVQGNVWYHVQSRTTPLCVGTCLPGSGAT